MASFIKRGDVWRALIRRPALGISMSESFKNKADAVAWATKIEHEINVGKHKVGSSRTVADAMHEYEKRVSPTKRANRWEAIRFAAFIRDFPDLAATKLTDISPQHMGKWRDARLAGVPARGIKPVGSATVLRDINLFSHVFTTARDEWKWISESPFKGVRRPTEPHPRVCRITDKEVESLLSALGYEHDQTPKTKSARIGAMLVWAIETAMRSGEIVDLRWDRINTEKRFAHLPRTKTDVPRDVPLSARALKILEQFEPLKKEFDGHVFGVSNSLRDALFRKAKKAAMLPDINFHDARREALTRLAKIFNVMELAKISGHKDVRILQSVYFAPTAADLADKLHQTST
ncbi:tyrosine-type recombinase/integrase [Pararobbsia alpina]|uniref:Tyr recombinase domain-containing protein n=1 Tax=Pararobbsia alpina TaxID=621374 RepID=A0A6S7BD40_9BURK|nr:site-specific integrase [Pararobbsia alpina]CAB3784719.1 hypothetical protein LMG28138_01865 [Pararobbsia alpina]